jgi:hypothetical protein
MVWANEQIDECRGQHSICRNYFVPEHERQYRPTRLLDVENKPMVRLVETSELPISIRLDYIALSHCWGQREIGYKLRKDTVEQMKKSIPVEELAQNFQDAIDIAQARIPIFMGRHTLHYPRLGGRLDQGVQDYGTSLCERSVHCISNCPC